MTTRRRFLRSAAMGGGVLASGAGVLDWATDSLVPNLSSVSAAEAVNAAAAVQFQPEMEPLVRLIEETPRDQLIEVMAAKVRDGLSYQHVLAALLLAGVRNVQPRPSVGFKFHAVLVVNSAHLASLASADQDRWLPIFWALDYFKSSQARDVREGNWTMSPVNESAVPSPTTAVAAFQSAMDQWDVEAADAAVAGLARSATANEAFELFARYGARDFRSIGHKAIFVANSFRTLQCIGWRYAEPVLRSLAYALLNHEGQPNPSVSDLDADRPWRHNAKLVEQIRTDWTAGRVDQGATSELLAALREASPTDVSDLVAQQLNAGVGPQSLFDACYLSAGEMLMRQTGIVALHASTTTNALRYAFQTTADDNTRKMVLLQNAAFLTMFRDAMHNRGAVGDDKIDQLQPAEGDSGAEEVDEVFSTLGSNRKGAAQQALQQLKSGSSAERLMQTARRLVFLKGTDSHDYKFSSAILEDYYQVSPEWRDHFLAASCYKLRASTDRDNGLIDRVRSAFV